MAAVAGQTPYYKPGELVDFPPAPPAEDASGRSGAAAVVKMSAQQGVVAINDRGAEQMPPRRCATVRGPCW
eukprot:5276403-Pyramimonas_sp.AAC.1